MDLSESQMRIFQHTSLKDLCANSATVHCFHHHDHVPVFLKSQRNINQMTLSKEQFTRFVENYVSHIVDGLDVESLETMVFDLLCREYETYTEEQIVGEIEELYGEEVAADLVESATDVTV